MASDETQLKIIEAAGQVFAEMGLKKATIREISRLAGVNLASINYHFKSKELLYAEVIRHVHNRRVERNPLPEWPPGTPPEQRLRDFIANLMNFIQSEQAPWEARLMRAEMLQPTSVCEEIVENFVRPHFGLLLGILEELTPDLPLPRRQQLGFSVIGQCAFYKFQRDVVRLLIPEESLRDDFTSQRLAEHIFQVMLFAVRELRSSSVSVSRTAAVSGSESEAPVRQES